MMRQIPDCLQRRYQVMDALVNDLNSAYSTQSNDRDSKLDLAEDDRGVKLMCKFWHILKQDPNCDLQNVVQQRLSLNAVNSGTFNSQNITCYQMGNEEKITCGKGSCVKSQDPNSKASGGSCCDRKPQQVDCKPVPICPKHGPKTPLTQALENMKEAASAEKKCFEKTGELMTVQEQLKDQIAQLELRENDEVALLKEADVIWKAMENEYKQKLEESKRRQEDLLSQIRDAEASASKWKKNKKNLEEQMKNVNKCIQEMRDRYNKKSNDLKAMEAETADLQKRIESNTYEIANASNILEAKMKAFDDKMKKLSEESKKLEIVKNREEEIKNEKIEKGNECVKEAREELAKLCRVLLKKKLENEDLRAEARALAEEIDVLKTTCDECGDKCKNKEQSLVDEIEKCKGEIEKFKLRCTKCHVSCDTMNLRKYCTDCPRCQEEMDPCVYTGGKCIELAMNDCVCMTIKSKFMNNVFDNMRTVLERQIESKPGKAVAAQVLQCLKNSTNGKLDQPTRKKLQEFILATVKTNLNLTIIGGAVKTRCEMDPDTYKELLKCLTKVKTVKPEKADKGTDSRKEPCARWGGTSECNCPKGPKDCICRKKAPKPPSDPGPCGQLEEDKKDIGELSTCPHKDKTPCGPLCANAEPKSDIAKKVEKSWKPKPCKGEKCTFNSNMRAAQCTLGKDYINKKISGTKGYKTNIPVIHIPSDIDETLCDCDVGYNACDCYGSTKMKKIKGLIPKTSEILTKNQISGESEFKKMFGCNDTTIPVTVMGQNGIKAGFHAKLTKTDSGQMALDVKRLSEVGEIASQMTEYPVSLFKTSSCLKLIVTQNIKQPNAVLKRNSAGEMNVVLNGVYVPNQNNSKLLEPQEKMFEIRVKNKDVKYPGKTFLKVTPSGNYHFVLEKEFEKLYKEIINDYLGDISECSTRVSRTISGTYVIDFEEGCNCHQNYHNALLKKTDSGSIKLIVNGPDLKSLKTDKLPYKRCRAAFENLYEELATCSTEIRKKPPEQNNYGSYLECGLQLDKDIRLEIRDQKHFVAEIFVKLNKLCSGQYSLVFKEKSEELFTGNLLITWLGRLPLRKTTERELIVFLNLNKEIKNQYGWLKMSSNGHIIVVVDKNTKGVQSDSADCIAIYNREKGMNTNYHQKPDCYKCGKSKCFCGKMFLTMDKMDMEKVNA